MNIGKEEWIRRVKGELKVLYGVVLSCSDYAGAYLRLLSENEFVPALERTAQLVAALADGQMEGKAIGASENYNEWSFALCMNEIDRSNRSQLTEQLYGYNSWDIYLYDLFNDGMPQLIAYSGNDTYLFTFSDGELVYSGRLGGGDSTVYITSMGEIINYSGRMMVYEISLLSLEGTTLEEKIIASDYSGNIVDYPKLEDMGYSDCVELFEFLRGASWNTAQSYDWQAIDLYLINGNAIQG